MSDTSACPISSHFGCLSPDRLSHALLWVALLIALYLFRVEISVRLLETWVCFDERPAIQQHIGDYYRNRAHQSKVTSDVAYDTAFYQYSRMLPHATQSDQLKMQMQIASFYACGTGLTQDLALAKSSYQQALALARQNHHLAAMSSIQQSLAEIDAAAYSKIPLRCPNKTELSTLSGLFSGLFQ